MSLASFSIHSSADLLLYYRFHETGIDHKIVRMISGLRRPNDITGCNQKAGRLYVEVYDTLEVHEFQGRRKLPNQDSSYTLSERLHLIRLQGAIREDDRARLLFTANIFVINLSS